MWDRLVFLCFPSSFPYGWCLFYNGERRWYAFTDNLWKSNPCTYYTCVWSFLKVGVLDCNEDNDCPFWCAFVFAFICALKSTDIFNIQVGDNCIFDLVALQPQANMFSVQIFELCRLTLLWFRKLLCILIQE